MAFVAVSGLIRAVKSEERNPVGGRWGPWTQGMLNRMRYDVQSYFRAYYRELRRHIAEHDPDFQVLHT